MKEIANSIRVISLKVIREDGKSLTIKPVKLDREEIEQLKNGDRGRILIFDRPDNLRTIVDLTK